MKIKLIDASGIEKASCCGEICDFTYNGEIVEGDKFIVTLSGCEFATLRLDEHLSESVVYCPGRYFEFKVPPARERDAYHPDLFGGTVHNIHAHESTDEEIYAQRNIAKNAYDTPGNKHIFPHASANFVTRGEPVFYARNAIDGMTMNTSHGAYPYHSWAGGAREDLEYYINFGRDVEVSELVFFLRADFAEDHDTYWKSLDVEFSDGTIASASFVKTSDGQRLVLPEKKVTSSIHLTNFKQVSTPLSWAALTEIEVYGNIVREEKNTMEIRSASNPKDFKHYTTERLREEFHISNLFTKDNLRLVYSHIDRIITGGAMPVHETLCLEGGKELASEYFLERREMGVINIGGAGIITVDGTDYELNPRDGIYIGMGAREIAMKSVDVNDPAKFYISSCPAHKTYPTVKIDITKAKKVPCGSAEDANKRVINQYIHPEVIKSCQLAMGLTRLDEGSVWNTMPCHTHDRRMEVYLYLDMSEDDVVFHLMGEPNQTRHIVMKNEEAVINPSWSIHSGVGTRAYTFIWAMCGENQEFTDMDHVLTRDLL